LAPGSYDWWKANVTSSVGAFATNGIDKMRTAFNNVTIGNVSPNLIMTTQSIYESYEDTGTDLRRYASNAVADAGFVNITFKNVPIVFDRDATSGNMYMLNSKFLKWVTHAEADMAMGSEGFQTPIGQDVSTAKILFQGQITCSNRRRLAILTGIS